MDGSTRNAGASEGGSAGSATALDRSWKAVCADAFAGAAFGAWTGSTVETALALSHPAAAAAAFAGALRSELAGEGARSDNAGRAMVGALAAGSGACSGTAAGFCGGGGATGAAATLGACGVFDPWDGFADFLASTLVVLSLQRSRSLTSSC